MSDAELIALASAVNVAVARVRALHDSYAPNRTLLGSDAQDVSGMCFDADHEPEVIALRDELRRRGVLSDGAALDAARREP